MKMFSGYWKREAVVCSASWTMNSYAQVEDKSFRRKLGQKNAKSAVIKVSKLRDHEFTIRHYAGEVAYNCEGFVEKNRDRLQENLVELLTEVPCRLCAAYATMARIAQQKRPLIVGWKGCCNTTKQAAQKGRATVAAPERSARKQRKSRRGRSLAGQLREGLSVLLRRLDTTEPYFIRCIKPNDHRASGAFDDSLVLHQLRCLGVLEAVHVQQRGYPVRLKHEDFLMRYRCCALKAMAEVGRTDADDSAKCAKLISAMVKRAKD